MRSGALQRMGFHSRKRTWLPQASQIEAAGTVRVEWKQQPELEVSCSPASLAARRQAAHHPRNRSRDAIPKLCLQAGCLALSTRPLVENHPPVHSKGTSGLSCYLEDPLPTGKIAPAYSPAPN